MVLKVLVTVAGMASAVAYASRSGQLQRACRRLLAQSASAPTIIAPPPPQKIKLALCQLHVTSDKESNLANAFNCIKEAASEGAQLVVLPEMFNCPYSNDSFPVYAEDIDAGKSPTYEMLSQAAATCRVTLVAGSIPERSDSKLYNTCCVFGTNGKLLAKHRKTHLFDIDIPGKMTFKESLTLTPGQSITVVDTPAGRIGVGICYDIRFPELAMLYANRGAQLIVYPGAFNMVTGPQHWELLQRARAVDNQLFVAACSPARNAEASYQAWGHSTIVGPFGEILGTAGHEPTIVYADIDYNQLEERRTNMPIAQQKRYDLYTILDKTL